MTTFHQLQPVTLDFFETAPLRVQCTMTAKCTPEQLFETLRGDTVWTEWAGVIQGVECATAVSVVITMSKFWRIAVVSVNAPSVAST